MEAGKQSKALHKLTTQEAFLGPWPARTLESGLSIVILNRKSGPARVPEMSPGLWWQS